MEGSVLNSLPDYVIKVGCALCLLSSCAVSPIRESGGKLATEPPAAANQQDTGPPPRPDNPAATTDEAAADSIRDSLPPSTLDEPEPSIHSGLWRRIADGLQLQAYYDRPEVIEQVRLYARRPDYFEQVGERARPFLHGIVEQIEQRGLPMEIALMPFVESGFNPNAVSPRAAAGPWQFMAGTGRSLGLRVDPWFDGRRDPVESTTAALDYLEIQQQRFAENWLLAFAAYNSGPANVGRILRNLGENATEVDFWQLPLPAETQIHVPRILALASILDSGGKTGFSFPEIADEEFLARVRVGPSASIVIVAELAGLEPETLRRLNPGFRQWWTPPDGNPDFLHMPREKAETLRLALLESPEIIQVRAKRYLIQPGDTLGGIARAMAVPVDVLRSHNNLRGDLIIAGDYLSIPGPGGDMALEPLAEPDSPKIYIVQTGDSLWAIARRNGLEAATLARINAISPNALILPGQQLLLGPAAEGR